MTPDRRDLLHVEEAEGILRGLPARVPPPGLTTSLRVIASKERQRRLNRLSLGTFIRSWRERFSVLAGGMVRSLALPFAGGVGSAVVLFSMCVVPTYPLRTTSSFDIPTTLTTQAAVKMIAPFATGEDDVVVDVTVDDQGRMIDYQIVGGSNVLGDAGLRRNLENTLLFMQFTPATTFGQPMTSRVRLWLSSSHIDVKG